MAWAQPEAPQTTVDPMIPRPYRVVRRVRETRDTFTLVLEPEHPGEGHPFAPGQFNMLYVFGVGEVPISISGDPGDPHRLVHTTRAVGPVTTAITRLRPGDVLGVRGPYGSHWPLEHAVGKDIVIVAGGIGLAPLRPTIYQILAQREKFGRVVVLYGARTPADLLYRRELRAWRARLDVDVLVTVDRATEDWHGHVGVVTALIPYAAFDVHDAVAFVCGPEIMMRYTVAALQQRGMPDEAIYISMERNMKCAVGFCGHCQYGPFFICKDGPVFSYDRVRWLFQRREV